MLRKKTNGVAFGPRASLAAGSGRGEVVDRRTFLTRSGLVAGTAAAVAAAAPRNARPRRPRRSRPGRLDAPSARRPALGRCPRPHAARPPRRGHLERPHRWRRCLGTSGWTPRAEKSPLGQHECGHGPPLHVRRHALWTRCPFRRTRPTRVAMRK